MTATPANKAFTVGYTYSGGRQSGLTYPSGRAIAYGFDAGGRIVSISVDGSSILASGQYFPFGGIRKWVWANGQSYERTFDKDGRVTTITLGPDTASYGDLSELFGYDSLNRLVSANLAAGQTQSFTYDANSNRTNATINGSSTVYTYPGTSHKLMSLSGGTSRSFTYDNAGNITATGGVTYVYDGRGRMKQAGAVTYLVNGLGQRVRKNTGSDTYFAYDEAGHLIGEYDSSGAPIQETVWLNDTPVAIIKPASPGFTVYNVWTDLLDSPRLVTDTSNNARWEWSNSDPFGNNLPNENPSGLGAFTYNLRFPGQYYDAETGKHYNYFRDYDATTGRYGQSDVLGLRGGLNTYSYVAAVPLSVTDPRGLDTFMCTAPLHALSHNFSERFSQWAHDNVPMAHHQYLCIKGEDGKMSCGGQDQRGKKWYDPIHSPGQPSVDDKYNPTTCKYAGSDKDVEQCVLKKFGGPRPPYGIPFGTDCQEWAEQILKECKESVKKQRDLRRQAR